MPSLTHLAIVDVETPAGSADDLLPEYGPHPLEGLLDLSIIRSDVLSLRLAHVSREFHLVVSGLRTLTMDGFGAQLMDWVVLRKARSITVPAVAGREVFSSVFRKRQEYGRLHVQQLVLLPSRPGVYSQHDLIGVEETVRERRKVFQGGPHGDMGMFSSLKRLVCTSEAAAAAAAAVDEEERENERRSGGKIGDGFRDFGVEELTEGWGVRTGVV